MIKKRIEQLFDALNKGIYEKENEIALSLLAAVAGESIILLGPPGVAKSMVARRLSKAFSGARSFEYLMSKFSTPDEIFGPVSISKLKDSDDYERVTEGYLPTADVVFLDEIWKAGPAIQNTLLTVINEKVFRNGNRLVSLPLKLLIAASNELPAQGEGLEALWDRLIIRLESKSIKQDENFDKMLLADGNEEITVPSELQITNDEYTNWHKAISKIGVSQDALHIIHQIRKSLQSVAIEGTDERRSVYVSDRRWKKIVNLLRTSAFLQDRETVEPEDLLPVYNCLWQEPEERDEIRRIVIRGTFMSFSERLAKMKKALEGDIKIARAARAANRISSRKIERDADKKLYDEFYYKLVDYPEGDCYIMARDFQVLGNMMHKLTDNPVRCLTEANYIGLLFWATIVGLGLKMKASERTISVVGDLAEVISTVIRWIIQFAPFGIMGIVLSSVAESGLEVFTTYGRLLCLLVGGMLFSALVINPILVGTSLRANPFPLIGFCLKHSAVSAFFTRSSAANIPVNMAICQRLGLDPDFYSVSIPLGATINMQGAAVTITVMTLAVCHTLGIEVSLPAAFALSALSTLGACGSSGVAGGSLLLIPMACSMFGIDNDVAMQAVAVGFVIGVVQDSMETALNSSSDVLFTITAELRDKGKKPSNLHISNF